MNPELAAVAGAVDVIVAGDKGFLALVDRPRILVRPSIASVSQEPVKLAAACPRAAPVVVALRCGDQTTPPRVVTTSVVLSRRASVSA